MSRAERDLALFHLVLGVVVIPFVVLGPGPVGWRMALAVCAYVVALPVLARVRGHPWLVRLWWFGLVLSVWQVLPDWFLVEFGTLAFPRDGFPDIGPVTAYMAGLWLVPTVLVVASGMAAEERGGRARGAIVAGGVGFVVYVAAEATFHLLPAWRAVNVTTLGGVALYVVPAQVLLSVTSYDAFLAVRDRSWWVVVPTTFLLMIAYLGAALVSFLVVEWIG